MDTPTPDDLPGTPLERLMAGLAANHGAYNVGRHSWTDSVRRADDVIVASCGRCGAIAHDGIWVLDDQGRAVTGIAWFTATGQPVRVRPFAWTKNRRPPLGVTPHQTAEQAYPGAEVGGTPPCPIAEDVSRS